MNEPVPSIPEDLMEKAWACFEEVDGIYINADALDVPDEAATAIARLLLSERLAQKERDAMIAEATQTFEWKGGDDWAAGYVDGKNAVAAAIRSAE